MYPGKHAHLRPLQPAFIMAGSGEAVTYAELEARSNRLAHLLRNRGLKRLDHYAIFMENNSRYLEACGAGERSGLYYTCVNSYLTGSELAYIVANSESRVLITSVAKLDVAREAIKECPKVELCIVVDGAGESDRMSSQAAPAAHSSFYSAMRVLPERRREAMFAVYGFCRAVDDIADDRGPTSAAERLAKLEQWRADIAAMRHETQYTRLFRS